MENTLKILYSLMLYVPQIVIAMSIVWGYEIVRKKRCWVYMIVSVIAVIILFSTVPALSQRIDFPLHGTYAALIVSLLFVGFCMQGHRFKIAKMLIMYISIFVLNISVRAVIAIFAEDFDMISDLLCALIVFALIYAYKRICAKRLTSKNKKILIMAGSLLVIGTAAMAVPLSKGRTDTPQYIIVFSLACVLSIIASFMLAIFSAQNDEYKIRVGVSEEKEKLLNEYFNGIKNNNSEMRRFRHDYKNHIHGMRHLLADGKYEELAWYLEELDNSQWINTKVVDVGNDFVNAILSDYIRKAEADHIKINVSGIIPENVHITDMDWSVILSNGIDNAIEAVQTLTEAKRNICIEFKTWNNKLIIEMKNNYNQPPKTLGTTIKTIKSDAENHGMGIKNIRSTVEKYHGNLTWEVMQEEKIFILKMMMWVN